MLHTMHSRIIQRETSRSSIRLLRSFSEQSQPSILSHGNAKRSREPDPAMHRRRSSSSLAFLSSGFVILGSAVGTCYLSSSSSDSLAFSDHQSAATDYHEELQTSPQKRSFFIFGDECRRKFFFNYERRIRTDSPPEKVFEYFASAEGPNGEVYMTPGDLMRAVVPVFPPSESSSIRGGHLKGESPPGDLHCPPSEFFMLFDTNSDGLVSFAEYIFLVTLLSIPEESFTVAFKMFDVDNNGEIDQEEFKKVMSLMRTYNRQGRQHRDGRRNGLKVSGRSVENGGLLEYFFGKDGKQALPLAKFVQFLKDLHDEIVRLEFAHYDYKTRGSITAKDFALSMVASADIRHTTELLDRADDLGRQPHLSGVRISYEEFSNFSKLQQSLQPLAFALFGHGQANGLLTKEDLRRAASHVCGIPLTENVIDVVFFMFDTNGDGSLSYGELLRLLQKREKEMPLPKAGSGIQGVIPCCWDCVGG